MTNHRAALKQALYDDFKLLYVRQFTTDWETQRMVRNLEIGVMSLPNLDALLRQAEREALESFLAELRIEEKGVLGSQRTLHFTDDFIAGYQSAVRDAGLICDDRLVALQVAQDDSEVTQ